MGETEYSEALKLGKKEYRARIAKGQFPYLPVLDEILSEADIKTEQNMGLVQVPLDFVVGTSTMGRTYSFAANFMPILDEETEFAVKWSNLSDAQMNEGIRDPIKAFEYMNRYYVLEGNKRVSVLKYFNAVSIPAIVTRKIPKLSDDYDVRLYYEYMRFNEITGLCSVEFTKLGNADKLLSLVGKEGRWDEETKEKFAKVMFDFFPVYSGLSLPGQETVHPHIRKSHPQCICSLPAALHCICHRDCHAHTKEGLQPSLSERTDSSGLSLHMIQ